jgi:hypothetical protein
MQAFLTQIEPALVSLAVAFVIAILGIIGKLILAITPKIDAWFIAKIGNEDYQGAKAIAVGIWLLLEKDFPQLTGAEKRKEMEAKLLARFPSLTQTEIDAINKEVNNLFSWTTKPSESCGTPQEPEPHVVENPEVEFVVESTKMEG